MSGTAKMSEGLQAGTSGTMESSMMETEEFYNPEGGEWTQKVDTGQLCRVCANTNEYLIPIFDGEGLEHELGMKIQKHLPIKVTQTDTLPLQMCYQCASTLIAWHDLVLSCVEADKKLRNLQAEDDDDDDDKGADMFESHSMDDSEPGEDVDQPSTSEPQSQVPQVPAPKKIAPSKEKKPKLKMVLVKGPPAGTSGQKTAAKTPATKALEMAKSKDGANQDSASERCQQSALVSFRAFLDTQSPWRSLPKTESVIDTPVDIKIEEHLIETGQHCSYCGTYFSSNSEYAIHLSLVHSSKVFHCSTCDTIFFESKARFLEHVKSHSSDERSGVQSSRRSRKNYTCKVCSCVYSSNTEFKKHMKLHKPHEKENSSKRMPIHCLFCNKPFTKRMDLKRHVLTAHNLTNDEEEDYAEENKLEVDIKQEVNVDNGEGCTQQVEQFAYSCDVCRKLFTRKQDLTRHRKQHTLEELAQMDNLFNDDDEDDAADYLLTHTKIPEEMTDVGAVKKDLDEITRARVEINGRVVYHCSHCSKHIVTRYSFIRHLRIHTGEKPFTCHVCGKQFRVQALLSRHVREVHDRIKNHACDLCGRRFANSNARNDHRRTHTGERPCVCHLCGKAFKTKASLFVHSKFHSDVFPHPCPHCDKRFRRRQQLNIHILHHTGEKPHTCQYCGKSFRLSKTLKDHTLIHTNKETFECVICGKRFAQERYLKNHARNHRLRLNKSLMSN